MSEYVYGPDQSVQINLFATQMYGNVETLLMYHTHKPLKKVLNGAEENAWNKRIKEIWKKFQKGTEKEFSSFKVFFRSFKVLRPDLYEETYKSMKAKELLLEYEGCIYYRWVCPFFYFKIWKHGIIL
jgi:arginyl-tRNA synthetase